MSLEFKFSEVEELEIGKMFVFLSKQSKHRCGEASNLSNSPTL